MRCAICNMLRRWVFEPLCGPLLFNRDMSLELDRLLEENERLRSEHRGDL